MLINEKCPQFHNYLSKKKKEFQEMPIKEKRRSNEQIQEAWDICKKYLDNLWENIARTPTEFIVLPGRIIYDLVTREGKVLQCQLIIWDRQSKKFSHHEVNGSFSSRSGNW